MLFFKITGCALTIQTTVLSDIVGVANVARAQAFVLVFTGLGALISVPLAGKFIFHRDLDSSFVIFHVVLFYLPFFHSNNSNVSEDLA